MASNVKLNQIVSVEKGVKSRHHSMISKLHHASGHDQLFNGLNKNYQPLDEDGHKLPEESVVVQCCCERSIEMFNASICELLDTVSTKDFGNANAVADIVLEDGTIVLKAVPPTFLLFLEKELNNISTFIEELPTLDPAEEWSKDEGSGLFKSKERQTQKTKKIEKPVTLYEATKEHPAQTQLVTSDELIGYWYQIKMSGAMPKTKKKELLDKTAGMLRAVKFAREAANNTEIERKSKIGESVLKHIFG